MATSLGAFFEKMISFSLIIVLNFIQKNRYFRIDKELHDAFTQSKAFSKPTKQTNSSSSNSYLRSHINLITDIASLVLHPFLNPNCVFLLKYLDLFSSLFPRSFNIIFDSCAIRLIFLWSAHS